MGTTPTGVKVGNLDIQFGSQYDQVKANQLVQSVQQTIAAVNRLANQASTAAADTTVPEHELAGETGLGPSHTVSGLEAGQVLIATSPTVAEFGFLKFSQMAQVDALSIEEAANGDVLSFVNGYWSAAPGGGGISIGNPGADAVLMWNPLANSGAGGYAWAIPGTGIKLMAGQISVNAAQLSHSLLLNLLADDHPQYALVIDTPQLGSPNVFTAINTFDLGLISLSDLDLTGNIEQQGLEGLEYRSQLTDDTANEGTWRMHVESGQLMFASVSDPDSGQTQGADGENWLYVQRIAEIVDTVGFSANYLTFNGFDIMVAAPGDGADFLPVIAGGVTYYLVTTTEPQGGGGSSTQFNLPAGWNSSSGAIPILLTVPQDLRIPYGCTLQEVSIQTQLAPGSTTGSCTITLTQSAFPYVTGTDITGGVSPAISSGTSYDNSTLSGWTTVFAQGVMIRATLTANTNFSSVKIFLRFK